MSSTNFQQHNNIYACMWLALLCSDRVDYQPTSRGSKAPQSTKMLGGFCLTYSNKPSYRHEYIDRTPSTERSGDKTENEMHLISAVAEKVMSVALQIHWWPSIRVSLMMNYYHFFLFL